MKKFCVIINLIVLIGFGCIENEEISIRRLALSELSSTDTIEQGTKKGFHLYLSSFKIDFENQIKQAGCSLDKVTAVWVREMKVIVEFPKQGFNPSVIERFSAAFSGPEGENTVIEREADNYVGSVYTLVKNERISDFTQVTAFNSGIKLNEKLSEDLICTTVFVLEVDAVAE